jgi:DNA-binding transcriptional regulator YiaG
MEPMHLRWPNAISLTRNQLAAVHRQLVEMGYNVQLRDLSSYANNIVQYCEPLDPEAQHGVQEIIEGILSDEDVAQDEWLGNQITGPEFRKLRQTYNYTQQALAAALGVNQATIWRWEQAESRIPPMAVLALKQLGDER